MTTKFTNEQLSTWADKLIEETYSDIEISRTDAHAESYRAQLALLKMARTALKDAPAHEATDWQVDEAVARMEGDSDMVLVPRGVLGAASGAIRHPGHEAGVTLGLLRHYSFRKQPTAFERGAKLARDGGGISDIWAACKSDDELEEVERGFHSADPLRTGAKDPE